MREKQELDWSVWFSTYGLLTAGRLLERFNIHLPHDELIRSVKNHQSVCFHLLRVPLKNVFNGIIMQQVHDYQVYVQKLFVDYLLSGEDAKDKSMPGGDTRREVEIQRKQVVDAGEGLREIEYSHYKLITESQAKLVVLSQSAGDSTQSAQQLEQAMASFVERAEDINVSFRTYRSQFYNLILRTMELLTLLPDYHIDQEKVAENKAALVFDALLGEE